MLVNFVANDQYRRLAAEGLDDLEPVFDTVFFLGEAGIKNQKVKTALGEEELVGGVHDFLTTKVPDVKTYFRFFYFLSV